MPPEGAKRGTWQLGRRVVSNRIARLYKLLERQIGDLLPPSGSTSANDRVTIVAPSHAVARQITQRVGSGALRGQVQVMTVWGLARRLVAGCGVAPVSGGELFPAVAAAELARVAPAIADDRLLRSRAVATMSDLISAGLVAEQLDPLRELLGDVDGDAQRIVMLVEAAAATQARLTRLGIGRPGELLAQATDLIDQQGDLATAVGRLIAVWFSGGHRATRHAATNPHPTM